jgi:hypothetical protein
MKVMMLAMATERSGEGKPPSEEALLAMHAFNEELQKAGVLLDLGGLMPPSFGVRMTFSGQKRTVVDGPFAEAKEFVAGYSLLEVKSMAEAIEWAKRAPYAGADGEEAVVEIRPLFDPSQFDVPGEAEERAKRLDEKAGKT